MEGGNNPSDCRATISDVRSVRLGAVVVRQVGLGVGMEIIKEKVL